ncbi:hypothetical protein GH741_12470 [Aquibacillus halophilus]|uniref:Cell division protein FtsK n=1 Tax=Aquibacillus halophilus TaxID=930132 RepID=A0A6A8DCU0_9BACI|nr:YpjP family protein [Aquibacillus halophilus]MRH43493.1 hypothetical protein [Aquibacillus halophilus]
MKLWIKKISVVLITFMALGVYIPPTYLDTSADNDEIVSAKTNFNDDIFTPVSEVEIGNESEQEEIDTDEYLIGIITEQAKEQTISKMGPRIAKQVEDDFSTSILPHIEQVVRDILVESGKEQFQYYGISEQPSAGYGEKIFHLYNFKANTDIAKFHVRRENRPGDGYWFNFHYHLKNDNFEEHHSIGEVFWAKDTPPKWMA